MTYKTYIQFGLIIQIKDLPLYTTDDGFDLGIEFTHIIDELNQRIKRSKLQIFRNVESKESKGARNIVHTE